jgi:hypothetical protein
LLALALLPGIGALGACAAGAAGPQVRIEPLAAEELVWLGRPDPRLELLGAARLASADRRFGGFSGLRLRDGRLHALTDHGILWDAPLPALEPWRVTPLGIPGRAGRLDSEALEIDRDGGWLVTLEGSNELLRFDGLDGAGAARATPLPPPLAQAPANRGVEAMARLADGSLLLIAEGPATSPAGVVAVRLLADGRHEVARYRSAPAFAATDAVAIDAGVLVLERRVSILGGLETRLALLAVEVEVAGTLPPVLEGRELGRFRFGQTGENFEGIAAAPQPDGGYELLLISDDDLGAVLRTVLLRLRLRP